MPVRASLRFGGVSAAILAIGVSSRSGVDPATPAGTPAPVHLPWHPDAPFLGSVDARQFVRATEWLFDPARWFEAGLALGRDAAHRPFLVAAVAVLIAFLVAAGRAARRTERRAAGGGGPAPVWSSLAAAFLGSFPWALAVAFAGWRLLESAAAEFSRSVGIGLCAGASALFSLLLAERLFRSGGVIRARLGWDGSMAGRVHRAVIAAAVPSVPLVFCVAATGSRLDPAPAHSLGRLALLGSLAVAAAFFWVVLRPERDGLMALFSLRPDSPILRRPGLPRAGTTGTAAALAVAAAIGYQAASGTLALAVLASLWFFLSLSILKSILVRRELGRGGTDAGGAREARVYQRTEARLTPVKLAGLSAIWGPALFLVVRSLMSG